jgi:hypothetical protein
MRVALVMTATGKIYHIILCLFFHKANVPYDRLPKAEHFQGTGGPESSVKEDSESRPGDQDALNLQDMKRRGIAH